MLIDMHSHLDLYPNPQSIISECDRREMYVLSVTTTPTAWTVTSSLVKGSERIRTALGLHPQLAAERFSEIDLFDNFLDQTKYVGEIGLDGSNEYKGSWKVQLDVFSSILGKCTSFGGRILSLHSRSAASMVIEQLKKSPDAGVPVFHWFSGTESELRSALQIKAWFSVGPTMLKSSKGKSLVSKIPRERILTETDGPFTQISARPQVPWDVQFAISELSLLWNLPKEEVEFLLQKNLRDLTRSL